jgi:hypothetical protein
MKTKRKTSDDLNRLEDERLLDEGENSLPEGLSGDRDDSIERLGEISQQNAYLTLFYFAKSICSLGAQGQTCIRQAMLSFREIRDSM